ncbi:MAG: PEP/pyruvate-binding domain-containing protein [Verrucomicrobiota bacterium]
MEIIHYFGIKDVPTNLGDLDTLGGKGVNLCSMTNAGFDVPPGFVVSTSAYRRFLEANNLTETIQKEAANVNPGDTEQVDLISAKLRKLFTGSPVPEDLRAEIEKAYKRLQQEGTDAVAVRSSATAEDLPEASFAGQQDTHLNISGAAPLLDAVRKCWASLWTARAMVYRSQQRIPAKGLALAVVVQKMAMADSAGIMFTANPVTGSRGEIVINAAWGLGEAVVAGHVTPDTMLVDKEKGEIKDVTVAEKTTMTSRTPEGTIEETVPKAKQKEQVLSDKLACELADIGKRVENHYGTPQDIEWAMEGDRFYLVQARPITAIPEAPDEVERVRVCEIERLRKLADGGRRVWVIHNLDEILPSPTPLSWDLINEFMSGKGGFGRMYRDLGYQQTDQVINQGFLDLVGGRIYADPERAAGLFYDRVPLKYSVEEAAKNPGLLDSAPTEFAPEKADAAFLAALPRIVRNTIRASKKRKAADARTVEKFETEIAPRFKEWISIKRKQDLSGFSTEQMLKELEERIEKGLHEIGSEELKPGLFGGMAQANMEARLIQIMGEEEGRQLALLLTQGLSGDTTIEQNEALFQLAQGNGTRAEYIEKYGHRGVGEMELAKRPYRLDDHYLRQVLSTFLGDNVTSPMELHNKNVEKRQQAESDLPEKLKQWGGSSFIEEITEMMHNAQKKLPYREIGKDYLIMGYDTIRMLLDVLGERWGLGLDVYFLHKDELSEFEKAPEEFKKKIAERKKQWRLLQQLDMPDVVDTDNLENLGLPEEYEHSNLLQGEPVASGVATAMALIVFNPEDVASDCRDYILVCPSTDPSWTALFVHARGVIVEKGGILSHGAIVARDYGIPAVVCHGATKRIANGQMIRVDGNQGKIFILDEDSSNA